MREGQRGRYREIEGGRERGRKSWRERRERGEGGGDRVREGIVVMDLRFVRSKIAKFISKTDEA